MLFPQLLFLYPKQESLFHTQNKEYVQLFIT